jgi:hypothetical protein
LSRNVESGHGLSLRWSVLEAGLVFCVWRGFPFLRSGEISVTDMLDLFCKINFGIVFTMKDLIIDLEQASVRDWFVVSMK